MDLERKRRRASCQQKVTNFFGKYNEICTRDKKNVRKKLKFIFDTSTNLRRILGTVEEKEVVEIEGGTLRFQPGIEGNSTSMERCVEGTVEVEMRGCRNIGS